MKRITIETPEMFKMMWQGFHATPIKEIGLAALNHIVKIQDAMEEISSANGDNRADRVLKQCPTELMMEDADFELLKTRLHAVPWSPISARPARDLLEQLNKVTSDPF